MQTDINVVVDIVLGRSFRSGFLNEIPKSVVVQATFGRAQRASLAQVAGLASAWEPLRDITATSFSTKPEYLDIYYRLAEQRDAYKLDEIMRVAHELNDVVLQGQVEIIQVVVRLLGSLSVVRRFLEDVRDSQEYRILVGSKPLELLKDLRVDVRDLFFCNVSSAKSTGW